MHLLLIFAVLINAAQVYTETCTNIRDCTQTKCASGEKLLCVEPITTCKCYNTSPGYIGVKCTDEADCSASCATGTIAECSNGSCHCTYTTG